MGLGGTGGVLYRVLPSRPRLRLISNILRLIGSYGRLTENILYILDLRYLGSGSWIWTWILDLDLDLDLGPGSGLNWSPDWPQESHILIYTGFKDLILASKDLSLRRPEIG